MEQKECACGKAPRLVFACSGASDVGAVSDQAARRVSRLKLASMGCLVAVANGLAFAMDPVKAAERIVVIDGCPENCAKMIMERAGVTSYDHIQLAELSMEKGHTSVDQEHITQAFSRAETILSDPR
jgi:uncharacterized metal-binding protein